MDIVFNIEIPAITKVVKIQMSDYDEEYMGDAPIATKYLNLGSISYESDDKYGAYNSRLELEVGMNLSY